MKKILFTLAFMPLTASACDAVCEAQLRAIGAWPTPVPAYGLPVQPVLPVPQDDGPWGKGYSIVTTTRPRRSLYDRDLTGSETVQRIVPNDALGQPIRGFDLGLE